MLVKRPDEKPSAESARQRKGGQRQRQHARSVIRQNSALPKDECPNGQGDDRGGGRSADRRHAIFLDPQPVFGRSVDCGDAAKAGSMEILQYGPTDRHCSAKVSYATLQDMTCEYLRDSSTLAMASDSFWDQMIASRLRG